VTGCFAKFGAGVDNNVLFELVLATAIGIGLAFSGGAERACVAIAAILLARLLLSLNFEPYLMIASSTFRQDVANRIDLMKSEVARNATISGPVSCSLMTVCYRAGKPFVFDDFAVAQRIATGRASKEQIDAEEKSRGIRFETVEPRLRWRDQRLSDLPKLF